MNQRQRPAFFSTPLLCLAAACSGGGGGDGSSGEPGTIGGTLLFVPAQGAAPLAEVEPNDAFDEPQLVGPIAPRAALTIRGRSDVDGGLDAYAFTAGERVRVRATLRFGADARGRAELAAYDPVGLAVVARAGADGALEFEAVGPFDVVVRGAGPESDYELELAAATPDEATARAGWLGALAAGGTARFAGGARRELTALEALDLHVVITGPADVVARAQRHARGVTEEAVAAQGTDFVLALAPLERVTIDAPAGAGVRVEARARAAAAPATRPAAERLPPLEHERAQLALAADAVPYLRAPANARGGEALVKPRAGADAEAEIARRGYARIGFVGEDVLHLEADLSGAADADARARATVALVRSLAASPRVEYAELNRLRRAYGGGSFTPNDAFYGLQWHYPLVRAPQAWQEARTFLAGSAPAAPVRVAVIDTGRKPHVDLDANTNTDLEYDFITDPDISLDGDGPDADATDEGDSEGIGPSSFHGTHVAGTIAAVTQNGVGVAGIGSVPVGQENASRVEVVHLRVLGQGGGTDADIARAIRYACGLTNPGLPVIAEQVDVINLSLGGPGFNQTVQANVTNARNRGVVVFAAAGNENSSVPSYPAAYANVVSVSAVDQNAARAPYSNFHATVDVAAPGGDTSVNTNPGTGPGQDEYVDGVLSTLVQESNDAPIYVFYQGTSMACPHAAGLAALMLVVNPVLTPAQIENALFDTAVDLGAPGRDVVFGEGLIDALGAIQQALGSGAGTASFAVNPTALTFGTQATSLQIALLNQGGGTIDVQSIVDDRSWITLVPGGPGAGIDIGSVTVNVDRDDPALAADGTYTGSVTVTTDAGVIAVPVGVVVETPQLPDVDLYVIAVDLSVDPPETVAQVIVNPSLALDFEYLLDELFAKPGQLLPPGEYLIACGSDDDSDLVLCGPGDVYCGIYPTLNDPALVRVNGSVDGIDFVVAPQGSVRTLLDPGSVRVPRGGLRLAPRAAAAPDAH